MRIFLLNLVFFALTLFVFHDYYLEQDCQQYKEKKECELFKKCDIDKDGCLDHTAFHIVTSTQEIAPLIHYQIVFLSSHTVDFTLVKTYIYYIYKPPIFVS